MSRLKPSYGSAPASVRQNQSLKGGAGGGDGGAGVRSGGEGDDGGSVDDVDEAVNGAVVLKAKSNKTHRVRGASNSRRLRQMQLLEMATKLTGNFTFPASY